MDYSLKNYFVLLPEEILEFQTCTVCKKYLSYLPTKVYSSGEIKCGRCSKVDDLGVVSSFYKIADNIMFPCINRFEGCQIRLAYKDVQEHEKTCKGGVYLCPICPRSIYKPESVLYLIDHFKKVHKGYILKNTLFQLNREVVTKEYYLYYNPHLNLIFLIFLRVNGNVLLINLSTVGDQQPELIKQQVKLFESYPEKTLFTTSWKKCSPWNKNLDMFSIWFKNDLICFSVEFLFKYSQTPVIWNHTSSELNSLDISSKKTELVDTYLSNIEVANIPRTNPDSSQKVFLQPASNLNQRQFKEIDWDAFPKIYLENIEHENVKRYFKNPTFSDCGKYIINEYGSRVMDIRCSFCENFFLLRDAGIWKCLGCECWLCSVCSKLIMTCTYCNRNIEEKSKCLLFKLDYYCRFECGKIINGLEYYNHERNCVRNEILSDEDILKKAFGLKVLKDEVLLKSNVFKVNNFYSEGRYYIADQRGFQYILEFKNTSFKLIWFNILHKYDPHKYYVDIKICDGIRPRTENLLTFELHRRSSFAIIFKKT